MSALAPIKLRYSYQNSYPGTWTTQGVGAQSAPYRRGWYPQMPATDGAVYAICRVKKWLYFGGTFTTIAGVDLPRLARMSLEDGVVDTSFRPAPNDTVWALATDGELLYVGGAFTALVPASGSVTRNRAARFDVFGNVDVSWDANADAEVRAIAVKEGTDHAYLGGLFDNVGSDAHNKLAEVDNEGIATLFACNLDGGSPNDKVLALAYDVSQNMLYVGGDFTSANATARNNILKCDGDAGTLDAWDPDADVRVRALALNYPLVYAGGDFTTIGGSSRNRLACLDQAAAANSFDPSPGLAVNSISLGGDGSRVFYGGSFGGKLLGASSDGELLPWSPAPNHDIQCVLAYKSTVFAGGSLTSVNGIGSTTETVGGGASVPFPLFRDSNTLFVKHTGAFQDAGAGTYADPKRTMAGALGTQPSFDDPKGGNNLTKTGVVQSQWDSWTAPAKGYWMAGPFNDANYLLVPNAVGLAMVVDAKFSMQWDVYISQLGSIHTIFDLYDGSAETVISVDAVGALVYKLSGTTHTSASGLVQAGKWYTITAELSSGGAKKAWVTEKGGLTTLAINQTGGTMFGIPTSIRMGRDRANAGRYLIGFLGPCAYYIQNNGGPGTWRDHMSSSNCVAYYPMQTLSGMELNTDIYYACVLDSETYEEAFNWHIDGSSLYAADGCRPIFKPRLGVKPGTYGARATGREKLNATGATTYYVTKVGNDATGARGDATLPFQTISAALADGSRVAGDTIQIEDSGVYVENIAGGANAVTIQAADGQTPTIRCTTITGALNLYGLTIPQGSYNPTASVDIYDCTLRMGLQFGVASGTFNVVSCLLVGNSQIVPASGTVCAIYVIGCFFKDSSMYLDGIKFVQVWGCTFDNKTLSTGLIRSYALEFNFCDTAASTTECYALVAYCKFILHATYAAIHGEVLGNGSTNKSLNVFRCEVDASDLVSALSDAIIYMDYAIGAGAQDMHSLMAASQCIVYGPTGTAKAFSGLIDEGASGGFVNLYLAFVNCIVIGATDTAIVMTQNLSGAFVGGINYYKVDACSVVNTTGTGILFAGWPDFIATRLAGKGNTSDFVYSGPGNQDLKYATGAIITNFLGGGSTVVTVGDPGFISTSDGDENLALTAASGCRFNGDAVQVTDQGASWAWIVNQADGSILNGFVVEGPTNSGAGVDNLVGVATRLEFLTLSGLGFGGVIGYENLDVYACEGAGCNGAAFTLGGVQATAERSIAWSCAGGAFIYGAAGVDSQHNSSWGCEIGRFSQPQSAGAVPAEVHSDNGIDVDSLIPVIYSDVGSVADDVVVAASSTRKNPLYVDAFTGNLSLKTKETGYPSDSPAKGTAADGSDMGAYEAEYGALFQDFIELDFAQTSTIDGTPWRNPDAMPREIVPIKPSEGEKPLGGSYSTAKAYKQQWTLFWDPSANPMQLDQLIALNQVYQDNGIVSLALDGVTFIDCVVLKSNTAKDDQIDQKYSNTDMPRPMESLVLREL